MIKFNKIFALVVMFVALCACERGNGGIKPDDDNSVDVEMPKYGYIFFDVVNPSTRATLFDGGRLEKNFSVLGYRYTATWESEQLTAYQKEDVPGAGVKMGIFGNDAAPGTDTVTWDGSVHSYTPLKDWHASLKYAFFAWYPDSLVANGGSADYIGSPYITYTLPTGVDRSTRVKMRDVMTACRIDYQKKEGLSVKFQMEHRLAAFDIFAVSMVNAKAVNDIWKGKVEGFDSVPEDTEVTIAVTELDLQLDSIRRTVKIPLDSKDATKVLVATDTIPTITYTGFDGYDAMQYSEQISLVGTDEKLILIPQEQTIKAKITGKYTITCNGLSQEYPISSDDINIYGLEDGVLHYLLLTITKSGVFVQVGEKEAWHNTDVEYEFN